MKPRLPGGVPSLMLLRAPLLIALGVLLAPPRLDGSIRSIASDTTHTAGGAAVVVTALAVRPDLPAPKIDGQLTDSIWRSAAPISDFWKMRPVDDQPASDRTEGWIAFDHDNLYIAFHAYGDPGRIRAPLSTRDNIFEDDVVGIFLDTFHDRRRGYLLFVNPLGVQADGVTGVGEDDDYSLDFVWRSAGRVTGDGYVVELAIPFRSLRFPNVEVQAWGVALLRMSPSRSEQDIYPRVDIDNNCLLCQTAELRGMTGVRAGHAVEILPAVTARQDGGRADYGAPFASQTTRAEVGGSLKYGVTPNLTADLTANPDFSQVESDAGQVEVNQRYALFFPEKRPFFQEGADIFNTPLDLVYTRTIYAPLGAGKLTGKAGRTSLGVLAAVDQNPLLPRGDVLPPGGAMPGSNAFFGIARVKQDVGRSSAVGILLTDRELAQSYNGVAGVDASLSFLNTWQLQVQAAYSDTRNLDGSGGSGQAFVAELNRNAEHLLVEVGYTDLSPQFRADAGFIRRVDIREGNLWTGWQMRPNGRVVQRVVPAVSYERTYDHAGTMQDERIGPQLRLNLALETSLHASYTAALERYGGVDFRYRRVDLEAETAPWRFWSGGLEYSEGGAINYDSVYLGWSRDLAVTSTFRFTAGFRLDASLVKETFWDGRGGPEVYDVNIWRGRATYQFTRELFLRAIAQWNTYDHTLGLNGLISYELSPGTVFFLGVDNGLEGPPGQPLQTMQRTVFVKASYLFRL